jgi:hypothetical protein
MIDMDVVDDMDEMREMGEMWIMGLFLVLFETFGSGWEWALVLDEIKL